MRLFPRNAAIALALVVCAGQALAPTAAAETPRFLLRSDWADDDVLAAPTAGGPQAVPRQLLGLWRVSLCVKRGLHRGHAWIRFENVYTHEVHTIGRFQRNVRPTRRRATGEVLYARTEQSGLHWDYDWRFEHQVRRGEYVIGSVTVRDPIVFGHDDLLGHGTVRANCITYARDAWQFYSGQHFDLAIVHTPEGFLRTIHRDGVDTTPAAHARPAGHSALLRRLPPVD